MMNNYEKEQLKIDAIAAENRILQLLIQYQAGWKIFTIADQLQLPNDVVSTAVIHLASIGHLNRGVAHQWFITSDGRSAFEDECKNVSLQTRNADLHFRNEVLLGAREKAGRMVQTEIQNAALPGGDRASRATNRVEETTIRACSGVERIRAVASYYDVSPSAASDWCSTGEVHQCNRCGKYRRFHRKNGRDGQAWQASCIECRKKARV